MTAPAKFYGIGVGPGDPELMTLKAARILAAVDRIFLPAGQAGSAGFAGRIVESLRLEANKFRPVPLCMSRQRDADLDAYDRAASEIASELHAGRSAAWIAEGDPLFYSTFIHVWAALVRHAPGIDVEVVPGVTSIQAAAAYAGLPLARLDESIAIVPAAYGIERLPELMREFSVVGLLKVHNVLDDLLDCLAAVNQPIDAVYVEKVGTREQRLVRNLESLRGTTVPYFSLVLLRCAGGQT